MPQSRALRTESYRAMLSSAAVPFNSILSVESSLRADPDFDVGDRQSVSQVAFLWLPENHRRTQRNGLWCQQKTSAATDATHGYTSLVSQASDLNPSSRTSGVSLSSQRCSHYPSQSCLEQRYYLCSNEKRLLLSGRSYGLVFPICSWMEAVQFSGRSLLYRSPQRCLSLRSARNLQQRPGLSVHQPFLYRAAAQQRDSHQYEWKRTMHRQCLDRKTVEKHQIRRPLHSRIYQRKSLVLRHQRLFSLLQLQAPSSGVILQNTRSDLQLCADMKHRSTDEPGCEFYRPMDNFSSCPQDLDNSPSCPQFSQPLTKKKYQKTPP